MTNTGFIIGAYPCAPSFHQKGNKKNKPSGGNFPTRRIFAGWNSLALKIFTPW
jgi:hypothetical protein